MTPDERHHFNQTLDSLHALLQPWLALVAHGRHVVDTLDAEDTRLAQAQRQVDADRAAVEQDRAGLNELLTLRQPDLEKARAMQGTVRDLERRVATLEEKRNHITAQLTDLQNRVTQAVQTVGPIA
jgi:chromosome segregation ATPase